MRVAVLNDIHGNLPALDAVLAELVTDSVDVIVIGGDVVTGPLPAETLDRLEQLDAPVRFLRGNADREAVAAYDARRTDPSTAADAPDREAAYTAARLAPEQRDRLAALPTTLSLEVDDLGEVLFCHGSPRRDNEIITTATGDARLSRILAATTQATVVGGHTHRQFDRRIAHHRFVNAGSVGRPYEGRPGAFWALLGDDVELRHTVYDIESAATLLRATAFPGIDAWLAESLTDPLDADAVAAEFERSVPSS